MTPDLSKVVDLKDYIEENQRTSKEIKSLYREAIEFISYFSWFKGIKRAYAGVLHPGIVGVFLLNISKSRSDVDEWLWVIVGDLPPAYLTCEDCKNPAQALDGYIGAMSEWVTAAETGQSVSALVPVNVPASKENAAKLKSRLKFLDDNILLMYRDDL